MHFFIEIASSSLGLRPYRTSCLLITKKVWCPTHIPTNIEYSSPEVVRARDGWKLKRIFIKVWSNLSTIWVGSWFSVSFWEALEQLFFRMILALFSRSSRFLISLRKYLVSLCNYSSLSRFLFSDSNSDPASSSVGWLIIYVAFILNSPASSPFRGSCSPPDSKMHLHAKWWLGSIAAY